jgi:hypothetical protein
MNAPTEITVELPPPPYSVAVFLIHGEDGTVTTYSASLLAYLRWLAAHPVPTDPGQVTLPTELGPVHQTKIPAEAIEAVWDAFAVARQLAGKAGEELGTTPPGPS